MPRPEFNFKFMLCLHCFCDYSSSFTPIFVVLFYFALHSSFSIKLRYTDQTILSHFCPPFCLSEMDFA